MSSLTEWYLEKYTKKLIGRTDIEHVLRRLDKLTLEEARMAIAENLKTTRSTVDDRVAVAYDQASVTDMEAARAIDWISKTVDNVDQVKRSSSPNLVSTKESYKSFQKTNCGRQSTNGSPHRIRRRTITLRVVLITRKQQPGFLKGASFRSGNPQVHFFGSTENVCPVLSPT